MLCDECRCVGFVADCRGSDITRLSNSSTAEQRRLRVILLTNNSLEVTVDSFRGLHWLGRLDLSYNDIQVIPDGAFGDLLNLRELDLSWNRLKRIEADVFLGLKSLRRLDLSHNRLVSLLSTTLSKLPLLETLSLYDNTLQDVAVDTFTSTVRLQVTYHILIRLRLLLLFLLLSFDRGLFYTSHCRSPSSQPVGAAACNTTTFYAL